MNRYSNDTPHRYRGLWRDIRGAIRGTDYDYTQGSIGRAILLLSIPMVLEMAMESIFAVTDIFFVARLGPNAIATVGITESILTLVYAIAMGLSMATTAIISRRVGEKNMEGAALSAMQSILLAVLVAIPISAVGFLFAPQILSLMGGNEQMTGELYIYTSIMLGSNAVILLLFIINAIFRGAGDAAISMRVLWLSNIINIILDPLLIFGVGPFPELGIAGAAIATTTGRGLGVIYQFQLLRRGNGRIVLHSAHLVVQGKIIKRLARLSLGGIGQHLIATSSWIALVRIIAEFGAEALAGYTIAIRILIFSILPSWGMSNAAATLVGQNLGAGRPDRAERSVWITGVVNMIFLGIVGLGFFIWAKHLILLFSDQPQVISIGTLSLQVICAGYLFYAWGMVISQAFNGAGDTDTPTLLNFICFWIVEIPLAYLLALTLKGGAEGVFWSIVVAESLLGILGIWIFRKGKWKQRTV